MPVTATGLLNDFRSLPGPTIVGYSRQSNWCPVAVYLRERCGKRDVRVYSRCIIVDGHSSVLADPVVRDFILQVDTLFPYGEPITAREAATILEYRLAIEEALS
jgi:hypothetical protein